MLPTSPKGRPTKRTYSVGNKPHQIATSIYPTATANPISVHSALLILAWLPRGPDRRLGHFGCAS